MKHSYFLAGITLRNFLRLIGKHGVSLYPGYLIRILFLLQNGIWASFLKGYERRKLGNLLKNHPVPENPVFIVGHWRTGSTFLHQLMNLDPQFVAPTAFQVSVPDSFLVSRKYYEPIMTKVMSKKRPMDNVALGFDEPQEDEYALMKLTLDSPLIKLLFPDNNEYFLNGFTDFIPSDKEKWKNELFNFCRKLDFQSGKRIVLKNPFHSMRIPMLTKMFPEAKFIHIYRNPYDVIPSTVNLWNIVGEQNRLKKRWIEPKLKDVISGFDRILKKTQQDLNALPKESWYELRFEDFEKNPKAEIQKMYDHFNWSFSEEYENNLTGKLEKLKDYKKNKFNLPESDKKLIHSMLKSHIDRYGY